MTIKNLLPTIRFEEDTHTYWDGDYKFSRSVTKLLKSLEKPFDAMYWSLKKSGGDAEKAEALRTEWEEKARFASMKGTIAHLMLELQAQGILGGDVDASIVEQVAILQAQYPTEAEYAFNCVDRAKEMLEHLKEEGYTLVDTELCVGLKDIDLAGTMDLLLRDAEGSLVVADWKTNEEIDKPSYGYFLEPFNRLPKSKINGYALQMSIYQEMLKMAGIVEPWAGIHKILWTDNGQGRIINVPHHHRVRDLLKKGE